MCLVDIQPLLSCISFGMLALRATHRAQENAFSHSYGIHINLIWKFIVHTFQKTGMGFSWGITLFSLQATTSALCWIIDFLSTFPLTFKDFILPIHFNILNVQLFSRLHTAVYGYGKIKPRLATHWILYVKPRATCPELIPVRHAGLNPISPQPDRKFWKSPG